MFQNALMAGRVMEMSWVVSTSLEAPREVQQSDILPDVLRLYNSLDSSKDFLVRCLAQLENKQNTITALHLLQSIAQPGVLVDFLESEV